MADYYLDRNGRSRNEHDGHGNARTQKRTFASSAYTSSKALAVRPTFRGKQNYNLVKAEAAPQPEEAEDGQTFETVPSDDAIRARQKRVLDEKLKRAKKWRLIIRNLPFKTTKEEISAAFEPFGTINEVILPESKKKPGTCSGFAFVQFADQKHAVEAQKALNLKQMNGRAVAIDWAVPKDTFMSSVIDAKPKVKPPPPAADWKKGKKTATYAKDAPVSNVQMDEQHDEEESDQSEDEDRSDGDSDGGASHSDSQSEDEMSEDSESDRKQRGRKNRDNPPEKEDAAVEEGRTLFIRNISYDTTDERLREVMQRFGKVKYALICKFPDTDHSKGSGFVQFVEKQSAIDCLDTCINTQKPLVVDGRSLAACPAVSRGQAGEIDETRKNKQPTDNRNLHLLRVSLVRPGTKQANNMSEADAQRREAIQVSNRAKLRDLHVFVSPNRLVIHNLPRRIDDKQLKQICLKALNHDTTAKLVECRVWRDMQHLDADGQGRSKGFGFVAFTQHAHANTVLQTLNNNAHIFTDLKRPIVEFSLEDRAKLNVRTERQKHMKQTQQSQQESKQSKLTPSQRSYNAHIHTNYVAPEKTDLEITKQNARAGGRKVLPSHLGPKVRHKDKAKLASTKAKKPVGKKSRAMRRQEARAVAVQMNTLNKKRPAAGKAKDSGQARKRAKHGQKTAVKYLTMS